MIHPAGITIVWQAAVFLGNVPVGDWPHGLPGIGLRILGGEVSKKGVIRVIVSQIWKEDELLVIGKSRVGNCVWPL